MFVSSEPHFWVLNIQSQQGKWSVRRKWPLQSDIVFLSLKQNTNAEQKSWPEVQHFRDLRGHSVIWWHNILTNNLSEYNKPSVFCSIVLLFHCLIDDSIYTIRANFGIMPKQNLIRAILGCKSVQPKYVVYLMVLFEQRAHLDYLEKSKEYIYIHTYSSGNKYTMDIIFFSQLNFWYNSSGSKEVKIIVSWNVIQWDFFLCVCVCAAG